ncbi:retrovirus-related pol polyprotein LINE-1, partial [Tanacetum coccineum]
GEGEVLRRRISYDDDKIGKFKDLLTSGQAILVDKAGNPLKMVEFLGEYDSEDEDSYGNGDYDDDSYDDDMYEGQDLSHELQAICDYLDIHENDLNRNKKNTPSSIGVSTDSEDTMNDYTPIGVASAVQEGVTPYVVDMTVEISSIGLFSFQFSSMDGLDAMLENGLWFIQNNLLILKKWHPDVNLLKEDVSMSSYARAMIEFRADVELKDNIVVAMPKITREGHYTCNICVEYEWKPPRCASCKVFEVRNVRRIQPNASSSANKKKGVEPTIEVSNSNLFKVLNLVDNDVDTGTTLIIDKIRKFEDLLSSGQAILVDDARNPLKKVKFLGDYDSKDEVASVDNDMARSLASERVGFGIQSLLEQWRDSIKAVDSNGYLRSCPSGLGGVDGCRGTSRYDRLADTRRIRVGSWNVRRLNGKGSKTREGNGYKLWNSDRIIAISVVMDGDTVNVISAYTPQVEGDLNGHIEAAADGYAGVHGGFGFRARNEEGRAILEFATTCDLATTQEGGDREAGDFVDELEWGCDAEKDSLGVASESTRTHSMHRESWWFSEEVQTKVAVKQSRFKELLSCRAGNQEDIDMANERYKVAKREANIAVARAKDKAYKDLYNVAFEVLGRRGVKWLTCLFNKIFSSAKIPDEWRLSEVISIYKNKGDAVAIRPAMLCGSECWPITKAQPNRVQVAEFRMRRWTCGKTMVEMIPNGIFRAEFDVDSIIDKMREGRLRWFGHVKRRPQTAPVRRAEALLIDGSKRRGRPKLRWEDRLKQDMKELLLSKDMTSDRNAWRDRIRNNG